MQLSCQYTFASLTVSYLLIMDGQVDIKNIHDEEKLSVKDLSIAEQPETVAINASAEIRYDYNNSTMSIPFNVRCRLVRRIDLHLVPISMFVYLLCVLDRTNIVRVIFHFPLLT